MVVNLTVSNIIVQPELNAAQITITPTFSSGEGGGVTNYEALSNLPKINTVELRGNKTAEDLGLQPEGDYATNAQLANKKNIIEPNVVYGNLNVKFKDVIWEDGFVKIAVTSPINHTQTYPHIGLSKVIVTKCKIDLGNGLFDLKPIVTYPSAPTKLNTFTWMYFLLSDVDGRLTENTDFTAIDLSYELWPDATLKLDTKTLLGENVVSEHQVSDAGHSEATIKTFNAIYPEFTGEKYRSELDALTLGLIPEIFTPTYCDKRDVNLIIKPYSNVGEEESIGSNPNVLTVVSHSGNYFLRYDNGLTSPEQFFENTILVGSRINDATTQSGTSYGFGMEFFEPGNNVGLSALAPTKQFKIVLGFTATTIGNVVNFGTDISKRFRVGDICIIGQDDNTDEQRTIIQVNGSYQVIVDSPYSINYTTNQWYSILGDLGTLWQADFTNLSYYQSPICAVVGAKLKKIRIATGANWQLVRKVARLTASNANNWDMYRGFGIINVDACIAYINANFKAESNRRMLADKLESSHGISPFLEYEDLKPNSPISKQMADIKLSEKINRNETLTAVEIQLLISNLVDSSPASLDTLNELAAALGDDPNFATTITNFIATKVSKETGKSLILDTEIVRLASVFNYELSKAAIEALLTGAITSHSHAADGLKADKLIAYAEKTVSFTLTDADSDKWINCNHATTPIVITVPTGLTDGKQFFIFQRGAAQVSILAGVGTTALATKLKLNAQYSACQISIEGANFKVIGETKS